MTAAIRVSNIGKSYRVQHASRRSPYGTLRETLVDIVKLPIRRLRGEFGDQLEDFWALKDIAFEVNAGEILGIIGRNGAGKSTLLKILSRITKPTTGQIELHGRVASLLEVGTGFHPELTGRENVYLNGSILGMRRSEIERKFDEIVAFAEIEKFLDTPVKRYSSGMYVRLAFAVAAHLEPEILIIDEVLAVGDASFQKKCLGKMQEVATGSGRTVLFVSHNLATIRSLCDRVVWLKQGQIVMDGPVAPAVEGFLSEMLGNQDLHYDIEHVERTLVREPDLKLCKLFLNGTDRVQHGIPLRVEIEFKVLRDIDGVSFGIGFTSLEGSRIMTIDSDVPGERFTFRKGTTGRVSMSIPEMQLQPGRYFLDIGARSGESMGIDLLSGFAQIEVLPSEETSPVIVGRTYCGGVRARATTELSLDD